MAVLREGGDLAKQLGYIRTRMRLSRAMATLLPAATIALLVHRGGGSGWPVALSVLGAYAAVQVLNFVARKVLELPRTDKEGFADDPAISHRYILAEPVFLGTLLFGVSACAIAARGTDEVQWIIAVGGIFATLVAVWAWIRITGTFMALLRDANA